MVWYVQRLFSLSKVSGQKAAQFVLHKFPQNFAYDAAEPQIEVCLTLSFLDQKLTVTLEEYRKYIRL